MKFTASNGGTLTANKFMAGVAVLELNSGISHLDDADMQALREFFRQERDEELGRWRWPENPDYVVYADEDDHVSTIHEPTGVEQGYFSRAVASTYAGRGGAEQAAHAYFEAHPEPKPWQDAKPGEIWALTVLDEGAERAYTVRPGRFVGEDARGEYWTPPFDCKTFTAGRRIWPEPSND